MLAIPQFSWDKMAYIIYKALFFCRLFTLVYFKYFSNILCCLKSRQNEKNVRTFVTIDSEHLTMPTVVNSFFLSFLKKKKRKEQHQLNCYP